VVKKPEEVVNPVNPEGRIAVDLSAEQEVQQSISETQALQETANK